VLCVLDVGAPDVPTLERAVAVAEGAQARLVVADVLPTVVVPPGRDAAPVARRQREERGRILEALVAPHRGRVEPTTVQLEGRRFLATIHAVHRDGHDLVITTAEDPEWLEGLLGSDDRHLLRKCPCAVWLTRRAGPPSTTRILAAVDFDPEDEASIVSELNLSILEHAATIAIADGAALDIVHVWDAPEASFVGLWSDRPADTTAELVDHARGRHRRATAHLERALRERVGEDAWTYLQPTIHLPRGRAEALVPQLTTRLGVDLMAVGTVARTGIPGVIIGNTAEAILDSAPCALLAFKPPGFVSPLRPA
jgi:nucleotide-binding universal stress UspA family protein